MADRILACWPCFSDYSWCHCGHPNDGLFWEPSTGEGYPPRNRSTKGLPEALFSFSVILLFPHRLRMTTKTSLIGSVGIAFGILAYSSSYSLRPWALKETLGARELVCDHQNPSQWLIEVPSGLGVTMNPWCGVGGSSWRMAFGRMTRSQKSKTRLVDGLCYRRTMETIQIMFDLLFCKPLPDRVSICSPCRIGIPSFRYRQGDYHNCRRC
mmetsp:Transcript_12875/g.36285  ORF Transcript_12875/g.36285 Transcript_12875/m.36285 type:complete len:211 (-) Transcript_12875:317-949(-)